MGELWQMIMLYNEGGNYINITDYVGIVILRGGGLKCDQILSSKVK